MTEQRISKTRSLLWRRAPRQALRWVIRSPFVELLRLEMILPRSLNLLCSGKTPRRLQRGGRHKANVNAQILVVGQVDEPLIHAAIFRLSMRSVA